MLLIGLILILVGIAVAMFVRHELGALCVLAGVILVIVGVVADADAATRYTVDGKHRPAAGERLRMQATGTSRLDWYLENQGNIAVCAAQQLPYQTYFVRATGAACSLGGAPGSRAYCNVRSYANYSLLPVWSKVDQGSYCLTDSIVNQAGIVSSTYDFRIELSQSRFRCCKSAYNAPGYAVWEIGPDRKVVKGTLWAR